jgi:hypothetical protein
VTETSPEPAPVLESDDHEWLVFLDGGEEVARHPVRTTVVGSELQVITTVVHLDGSPGKWEYRIDCAHPRRPRKWTGPDGVTVTHQDGMVRHDVRGEVRSHDDDVVVLTVAVDKLRLVCGDTLSVFTKP